MFITGLPPPGLEVVPVRIFVACANPDCGEEYPVETDDRHWDCPHCGRELENRFYPFLTARLMNARIHSEEADWRQHHDELLERARGRARELREHVDWLARDLGKLRVRLPEDSPARHEAAEAVDIATFIEDWDPQRPVEDDNGAWRDLHDRLLDGARDEILALEDAARAMESTMRSIKAELGLA